MNKFSTFLIRGFLSESKVVITTFATFKGNHDMKCVIVTAINNAGTNSIAIVTSVVIGNTIFSFTTNDVFILVKIQTKVSVLDSVDHCGFIGAAVT